MVWRVRPATGRTDSFTEMKSLKRVRPREERGKLPTDHSVLSYKLELFELYYCLELYEFYYYKIKFIKFVKSKIRSADEDVVTPLGRGLAAPSLRSPPPHSALTGWIHLVSACTDGCLVNRLIYRVTRPKHVPNIY